MIGLQGTKHYVQRATKGVPTPYHKVHASGLFSATMQLLTAHADRNAFTISRRILVSHEWTRENNEESNFLAGTNLRERLMNNIKSATYRMKTHLSKDETILVGEDHAAALGDVIEQPGGISHAGEVEDVHYSLILHEGVIVQVVMGSHAVLDGAEVLGRALDIPLLKRTVLFDGVWVIGGRINPVLPKRGRALASREQRLVRTHLKRIDGHEQVHVDKKAKRQNAFVIDRTILDVSERTSSYLAKTLSAGRLICLKLFGVSSGMFTSSAIASLRPCHSELHKTALTAASSLWRPRVTGSKRDA